MGSRSDDRSPRPPPGLRKSGANRGMEGGEDGPQPVCFGGHVGKAQSCQAQCHSVLLAAVHLEAVWLVRALEC